MVGYFFIPIFTKYLKTNTMNYKGGIKLAYKAFEQDLKNCKDYQQFKADAIRIEYEDRLLRESQNPYELNLIDPIYVLQPVEITVYYRVPEIDTKETRHLNRKLFTKLNKSI